MKLQTRGGSVPSWRYVPSNSGPIVSRPFDFSWKRAGALTHAHDGLHIWTLGLGSWGAWHAGTMGCMMVFREETAQDDIMENIIEREGDLGFEPRSQGLPY